MPNSYRTPGVYSGELPQFPAKIAQVETAIPAFIGYTEKAIKSDNNLRDIPTRITSILEYEMYFGKAQNEEGIEVTVTDDITNTNTQRSIKVNIINQSPFLMYYSLCLYFDNGGGPCYIVSVNDYENNNTPFPVLAADLTKGLNALEDYDEPTIIVFPDAKAISDVDAYYSLMNKAMKQCSKLQDRVVLIDMYNNDTDTLRNSSTLGNETEILKYAAAYHPYLKTIFNYSYSDEAVIIKHKLKGDCEGVGNLNGLKLSQLSNPHIEKPIETNFDTETETTPNFAVTTTPNPLFDIELYNQIKNGISKITVELPPSSAIAGVYVSVDSSRGVWKAPANVSLASVLKPTKSITNRLQDDLNVHPSGKSINAIRSFRGKGILVWGARTLAGNDNEWRYVSVRRFFNMVQESVKKAVVDFKFEANDANTWLRVTILIEDYLITLWRSGALAGAKPEEAFFIRVGLGKTMTSEDVIEGNMHIEIGMAVIRPAEFIILRLTQNVQSP